jgi:hypothetical protein
VYRALLLKMDRLEFHMIYDNRYSSLLDDDKNNRHKLIKN